MGKSSQVIKSARSDLEIGRTVRPLSQQFADKIIEHLDVCSSTKQDYSVHIKHFITFVEDEGFNQDSFLNFKQSLRYRTDIAVSTKNKYLVTSRIFLKELNRLGLLPTDITQNVKSFKQSKRHKVVGLDENEVKQVIKFLDQLPRSPQKSRFKAILALLILQGLRQIEIVRLNFSDVNLVSQTILILGKGRDDKELIDLHPETAKVLKQYIRANQIADGPLFQSQSNNSKNQRLSTRGLRKIVKSILNGLDIDKGVHGFRHYFVTKLISSYQGDLLEVARYTRHQSIETLQVYNDNIKRKADLPRYYQAFESVAF